MSQEHMRRLRAVGINTPRFQEDTASTMWQKQTKRLEYLLSLRGQPGASQATLRFIPYKMKEECLYTLRIAAAQARDNDEDLDFYSLQLWDMAEMMLQGDANGRRCVSLSVVEHIKDMMSYRHFPNPTYLEFEYISRIWGFIVTWEDIAVDEHILSCLGALFSQFHQYQLSADERAISQVLKREQVGVDFSDDCAICAEAVRPGEFITTLAPFCTHWYHSDCIKAWFMAGKDEGGNSTCPMCRTQIDLPGTWKVPRPGQ